MLKSSKFAIFLVIFAIVGMFLSPPVYAHEDLDPSPLMAGQGSEERHCIIYLTAVTLEKDIDPNDVSAALKGVEVPPPEFGGCYNTPSEALRVGTNGDISLPDSASRSEINNAILQHQAEMFSMSGDMITLSPTVVAIGYDYTNYQGSSWIFLDRSGTGCNASGTQYVDFKDYRVDPAGADDDMESIVPYANCDSIHVYQHPNYAGSQLHFSGPTASLYDPYTGLNLNNLVSSSWQAG